MTPLETLLNHIQNNALGATEMVVGFAATRPHDSAFTRRDLPVTPLEKRSWDLLALLKEMACLHVTVPIMPKRASGIDRYVNFMIDKTLPTLEQGNSACPTGCIRKKKSCSAFPFLSGKR